MRLLNLVGVVALWGAFAVGCGESSSKASESTKDATKTEGTAKPVNDNPDPANCPVSGHAVDGKTFVTYNGKKYEFCCDDCIAPFNADPQKFIAKK